MSAMNIGDIILSIEKSNKVYISIEPFNPDYLGHKGIWMLFGLNDDSKYICLNVGKTTDIGREILYDMGCLSYVKSSGESGKPYINQFGEDCNFKWESGKTQECLYPYIAGMYNHLLFVYAFDGSKSDNKKMRDAEKQIAELFHPLFWRNGGIYTKPCQVGLKINLYQNIKDVRNKLSKLKL